MITLRSPIDYDQLPPREQSLPKPENSRRGVGAMFWDRTTTDEQGRYELFVGPGKHRLSGPAGSDTVVLDIRVQPEIEHNFHSDRPEAGTLSGRVVLRSDARHGVGEAQISGASVDPKRYGEFIVACDADGRFQVRRNLADLLVQATSQDRTLAAIVRVAADDDNVVIPVGPCTSAHGRLIDKRTGAALANQLVRFGIPIHYSGSMGITAFGGGSRTNSHGEFRLAPLATGREFQVYVVSESRRDHQPREIHQLTSVRATRPRHSTWVRSRWTISIIPQPSTTSSTNYSNAPASPLSGPLIARPNDCDRNCAMRD